MPQGVTASRAEQRRIHGRNDLVADIDIATRSITRPRKRIGESGTRGIEVDSYNVTRAGMSSAGKKREYEHASANRRLDEVFHGFRSEVEVGFFAGFA